jgi:hypothetical protein
MSCPRNVQVNMWDDKKTVSIDTLNTISHFLSLRFYFLITLNFCWLLILSLILHKVVCKLWVKKVFKRCEVEKLQLQICFKHKTFSFEPQLIKYNIKWKVMFILQIFLKVLLLEENGPFSLEGGLWPFGIKLVHYSSKDKTERKKDLLSLMSIFNKQQFTIISTTIHFQMPTLLYFFETQHCKEIVYWCEKKWVYWNEIVKDTRVDFVVMSSQNIENFAV